MSIVGTSIVMDTSALVAILNAESDAEEIAERMLSARSVHMSAATFLECMKVMARVDPDTGCARLQQLVSMLRADLVPMDADLAASCWQAFERYGHGSGHRADLNMGDCFSYALARTRQLPLLFKGGDFIHTDIEPALKPA